VDSYKALKNWLRRLSAATHANLELRDPDIPQVIRLPRNSTEAEFRQFLPPLAAAMVRRGYELERRKDHVSVEEARLWYQRAFDADGADEETRLEAACHLGVSCDIVEMQTASGMLRCGTSVQSTSMSRQG
jgi:hypothetical protein